MFQAAVLTLLMIYESTTGNLKRYEVLLQGCLMFSSKGRVRAYLNRLATQSNGDINAFDEEGYTPLMDAVTIPSVSVELVQTLLKHGAEVNTEVRSEFGSK